VLVWLTAAVHCRVDGELGRKEEGVLLEDKTAVIYGAGGALGGAVARTFAREGARVFLAGPTRASLDAIARDIAAAGGVGEVSELDALDERAVESHTQHIVQQAGRIDISFNLVGVALPQGTPLADLSVDDFTAPIAAYMRTHLLTARAAAGYMLETGSGVILMMTTTPDRLGMPLVGPFGVMCAAVEALSHTLAAELGPRGIRVVCLRSTGSPEAAGVQWAFGRHAEAAGKSTDEFQRAMEDSTMLRRLTTLAEVAEMAAFMASDRASATTATAANLTCGLVVE
jgi:NAD(P)-dependent dehydrogenase (short-subunit alcohol dehydrogenase family)